MLCNTGKIFFDNYKLASNRFSDLYNNSKTYEEREKVTNEFMKVFIDYKSHVDHCLECNFDDRERM
jgi:hypothetical protein